MLEQQVKIDLPADKELAKLVVQAQTEQSGRAQQMGKMGSWFGSRDNAVVYLAAAVIILAMAGSVILAIFDTTVRSDMAKAFAALAISALGYMFGSMRGSGD